MSTIHVDRVPLNIFLDEDAHRKHLQLISWEGVTAVWRNRHNTARRDGRVNLIDIVDLTLDHDIAPFHEKAYTPCKVYR
nr:MAG TPA: hypothetical protein [Caudoviricetes sp.]